MSPQPQAVALSKVFLGIVVFGCGAVVMMFELLGSRVLAPYSGTSLYVWTNIIGVILGSLSLGYWLGGRLTDRYPRPLGLFLIILAAALLVMLVNVLKTPFLSALSTRVVDPRWASLVASLGLFSLPGILLGMVSPYAVRLAQDSPEHLGRTVGSLYALSTAGSIAGTFLAGFVLIPMQGTTGLLTILAACLAVAALLVLVAARPDKSQVLPMLAVAATFGLLQMWVNPDLTVVESEYNSIRIYESVDAATQRGMRVLELNNYVNSGMYLDNGDPAFDYLEFFRLPEHFVPGFNKALIFGAGAYSFPKYFLAHYPQASLDVVEIDPRLTALAREHFRLRDDPHMRIFHEDGRTYINRCRELYEVVYFDVFRSMYSVPDHLTTLECAQQVSRCLTDNGVAVYNVLGSLEGPSSRFIQAEIMTLKQVFPFLYVFPVDDGQDKLTTQNIILVAAKKPLTSLTNKDAPLDRMLATSLIPEELTYHARVFTDDFFPANSFLDAY